MQSLDMIQSLENALAMLRWVGAQIAAPLRKGDTPDNFTLGIPETHTTTIEGDTGWSSRPPALLECPQCESEIHQRRSRDKIDCPRCTARFEYDAFPDLDLLELRCSKCRDQMEHGRRHPEQISVPEWAECNGCGYHWEFSHSFR